MTHEEAIARLEQMAEHAVHTVGETPYVIGLDDGLALYAAIQIIKAQQPRVLTEEDFIDNPLVDNNGNVPAWCEHRVFNGIAHDVDGWTAINQRWVCGFRTQRYWTARPTEEQSQAVKWDADISR